MRKQILMSVLAASMFTACTSETADLDSLTERVESIENRLDGIGEEQAASLEETLADIYLQLTTLSDANSDLSGLIADIEALELLLETLQETNADEEDIADVLAQLEALQDKVDGNSDMIDAVEDLVSGEAQVWWGNIATADDVSMFAEGNYKIISGDVYLNSTNVLSTLSDVVFVGGNVEVSNIETLDWNVENIGGSLLVVDQVELSSITMDKLKSIGGEFTVVNNSKLATLEVPALAYVNDKLHVDSFISGEDEGGYFEKAYITSFDLTGLVAVNNDMVLNAVGDATITLDALTEVHGDLELTGLSETATLACPELLSVDGNFYVNNNAKLATFEVPKLMTIGNELQFNNNSGGGGVGIGFGGESTGIEYLTTFEELVEVGGGVTIASNQSLTAIDAFNKLESVGSYSTIYIESHPKLTTFTAFNALTEAYNINFFAVENFDDADATLSMDAFNNVESVVNVAIDYITVKLDKFEVFGMLTQLSGTGEFGGQYSPLRIQDEFVGLHMIDYLGWGGLKVYIETPAEAYTNWCSFNDVITNKEEGLQMYGDIIFNERVEGVSDFTTVDNSTITSCE
ncbi:hypothetical protein [Flammeovirga sp. SubArs3]|uniref:hypothetical protein n=1 Tax=Flammeovirga sp. SubArs3 TaxID=2995316 RepID=UPI00248B388C|nr:hypothetical protein [Flammeovirga sp. SubArs3]